MATETTAQMMGRGLKSARALGLPLLLPGGPLSPPPHQEVQAREFPGGAVVRTRRFHCREPGELRSHKLPGAAKKKEHTELAAEPERGTGDKTTVRAG